MGTQIVDTREGAQVWTGHDLGFQNAVKLLESYGLPNGLLPIDNIQEVGYVEESGYFWVKQKKSKSHFFKLINRYVSYADEISGCFEGKSIKKLNGVKANEFFVWLSIAEILQRDSHAGQLFFNTHTGLGKWYPAEAFTLQE